MGLPKPISKAIEDAEKVLATLNFVKDKIPDAKFHQTNYYKGFSAKSVNANYTNFEFIKGFNALYVVPFIELDFEYNGNMEKIRINSSPRSNRLIYITYSREHKQRVINFSRLNLNLKNNNFKDDMLNACRIKILDFIKDHPEHKLNQKHLEPRLKKLLLFT